MLPIQDISSHVFLLLHDHYYLQKQGHLQLAMPIVMKGFAVTHRIFLVMDTLGEIITRGTIVYAYLGWNTLYVLDGKPW